MSKEIARAIETEMRNFAIEIAYGDAGERAASAEKLRSAIRAELAAERERWKQAAEAMAQEAERKFPANGTVAHWLRALVAKRGA